MDQSLIGAGARHYQQLRMRREFVFDDRLTTGYYEDENTFKIRDTTIKYTKSPQTYLFEELIVFF